MLNFRRLRQDFSSNILKEGKELHDQKMVTSAKIIELDGDSIRLSARIKGQFENCYESEIEIDRMESSTVDSNCDCPYSYDCQHIAALIYHLEENLDTILVSYSNEANLEESEHVEDKDKDKLLETIEQAKTKEEERANQKFQEELLDEYKYSSSLLGRSPFFMPKDNIQKIDRAELAIMFSFPQSASADGLVTKDPEIQMALRLPYRSKPLHIPHIKGFLNAIRFHEPVIISGKRYYFGPDSFSLVHYNILKNLMNHIGYTLNQNDRNQRFVELESGAFGDLLYRAYHFAIEQQSKKGIVNEDEMILPCLYHETIETPLNFSHTKAIFEFKLECLESPTKKLFLQPYLVIEDQQIRLEESLLFECAHPGLIYENTYYPFPRHIKRVHLKDVFKIHDMVIPEPLVGTFIENALPELMRFGEVSNQQVIENFVTLPYVNEVKARCKISYIDNEMDAELYFIYDDKEVPASDNHLKYEDVTQFVSQEGILSRNLVQEQRLIEELFQGFIFNEDQGLFVAKSDKVVVDFMTEVVPKWQEIVEFDCPQNLLDQFIYDDTSFELKFSEMEQIDSYEVQLIVNGHLQGIPLDLLWECCSSKRKFIELEHSHAKRKKNGSSNRSKLYKILVLDLDRIVPIIQIFDEIGLKQVDNHKEVRPLWSLASINESTFEGLPVKFSMTKKLKAIQNQMVGLSDFASTPIPKDIKASLRNYQTEGVEWLERLRSMHLNGVLADDMGLGKTLQAIVALTQNKKVDPKALSIVICPTSLLYNWQEEFQRFNPKLKVMVIDGIPSQRKKMLKETSKYDVLITSYSLLQKDVDDYKKILFSYIILDEAQHIKNRGTRNAQSVKLLHSKHKLILTGTPVENSLSELWSLFDFLMPGLLSSYERFLEKYVKDSGHLQKGNLEKLRKKVAPFILRRMKADVLDDLPEVSELIYHCQLTPYQQELYKSYADSAREELSNLVQKEGFEKVQIHVLATLTRLKQICCHPAIFAKEEAEKADSAKYEMLLELLTTLIEGNHKVVIFSQYTRMLGIMRKDLTQLGIQFAYLDGSSKNRLEIVKRFNSDPSISVFLVSLKAGGSGLNLVGADTVIHYDMWWNPAVENQATDRVHRIGQKKAVSSYKLITLGTIEEKILAMQEKKKGIVKKLISSDEEAMTKLTWEEVLELLQT